MVRSATWDQFALEAAVWVKPAEATKTAMSHRVPLSRQALELLADAGRSGVAWSRPGSKMGSPAAKPLQDDTIEVDPIRHANRLGSYTIATQLASSTTGAIRVGNLEKGSAAGRS